MFFKGATSLIHTVEIKFNQDKNKDYVHIADGYFQFKSEITIDEEGRLFKRVIFPEIDIKINIEHKGNYFIKTDNSRYMDQKLSEYQDMVNKKLNEPMVCTPTLGRDIVKRNVITSVCPEYIRVMISEH